MRSNRIGRRIERWGDSHPENDEVHAGAGQTFDKPAMPRVMRPRPQGGDKIESKPTAADRDDQADNVAMVS
jgi:hypothetical protein